VSYRFAASHRGGSGAPLVAIHGFLDTWRTWELVLPALERHHEVLAPTLPGHAGGPSSPDGADARTLADAVESAIDDAGFATAHLVGNSLGGFVALELAARGRAASVVALAPAGSAPPSTFATQAEVVDALAAIAPHVDTLVATSAGRRQATRLVSERYEHIPRDLVAHLVIAAAACRGAQRLLAAAPRERWTLDTERIDCPVRIVWGAEDRLLPWPEAAERFRTGLPLATWDVLDGVGHCPQLDVPEVAAELILATTAR
jgi:pimeloyl-ACP methyl ester carboxylesterase